MDLITAMILVAAFLTLAALAGGVSAMVTDGEIAHHRSGEWMFARVGAQGLTLFLLWLSQVA
jgi:hypothetical protein